MIKACQVTDTGGVDDKGFNQTAWKGVQDAEKELGVEAKLLESKAETDYVPNINSFIGEKCDIIITVGFLLGDATKEAAEANPDTAVLDRRLCLRDNPVIPTTTCSARSSPPTRPPSSPATSRRACRRPAWSAPSAASTSRR